VAANETTDLAKEKHTLARQGTFACVNTEGKNKIIVKPVLREQQCMTMNDDASCRCQQPRRQSDYGRRGAGYPASVHLYDIGHGSHPYRSRVSQLKNDGILTGHGKITVSISVTVRIHIGHDFLLYKMTVSISVTEI